MSNFDLPRGKTDDGVQGGRWEVGLEATSGSEGPKQMGKGRENHGKEITAKDEELGGLFRMSPGMARRWIIAVGKGRGHRPQIPGGFAAHGRLVSAAVCCFFHCLISLCTWVQSPKASNFAFRQTVFVTLSMAPGRNF